MRLAIAEVCGNLSKPKALPWLRLLSFGFLGVFGGFQAAQGLQSSLNATLGELNLACLPLVRRSETEFPKRKLGSPGNFRCRP